MRSRDGLVFKLASTPQELEQIRALSYETFVEEIPQHPSREDRLHTDKFEGENTYFIGLDGGRLIAMMALRARRPFSLDQKLEDLNSYLPPHRSPCELRLLAVRPEYRKRRVAAHLMALAWKVCQHRSYDLALISGTTRELELYRHMGFEPFGPLVGTPGAYYQPMYLTPARFREFLQGFLGKVFPELFRDPENLLPGPVKIEPWVREALVAPPISHRSFEFKALLRAAKGTLSEMTGGTRVEIAAGSGTLANDMIGAQLAAEEGEGLVLSNGEFGDRLLDHARRFGLRHTSLRFPWGETFDYDAIEGALGRMGDPRWVWCVHGETSTGVLNDLPRLKEFCKARELSLSLDAVSTIGAVPMDLRGVRFASGCSGKALGAFPGLALVFYDQPRANGKTARSLDLGFFADANGIPFTLSSNLVNALRAALERLDVEARAAQVEEVSGWLRKELEGVGLPALAARDEAFPAVTTIPLPPTVSSLDVGQRLINAGFLVSFESGYLVDRNWIQLCLMRESSVALVKPVVDLLEEIIKSPS
jgi:aspartate aminotransferase-like enzyme/GNAT superfamily N-acetyltransferase